MGIFGFALSLQVCTPQNDVAANAHVPTLSEEADVIALIREHRAPISNKPVVAYEDDLATKQHPYYCKGQIDVMEFPDTQGDLISRNWRVNLVDNLVGGPIDTTNSHILADAASTESPTPEPIKRCLDGSDPILLDSTTLPDDGTNDNNDDPE